MSFKAISLKNGAQILTLYDAFDYIQTFATIGDEPIQFGMRQFMRSTTLAKKAACLARLAKLCPAHFSMMVFWTEMAMEQH